MEQPSRPPRDWFKFWLHFICGAIVGLVVVGGGVLRGYRGNTWNWKLGAAITVGALSIGLWAGLRTDEFWEEGLPWLAWGRGGDADSDWRLLLWIPVVALIFAAALIVAHRYALI